MFACMREFKVEAKVRGLWWIAWVVLLVIKAMAMIVGRVMK